MAGQRARILALGLAVVAMFAALAVLGLWTQSASPVAPLPPPTQTPQAAITAHQAYIQARIVAQSWQADARLVGISDSWSNANAERLLAGQEGWSLTFYSPGTREVQYISVDHDSVRLTRRRSVPTTPPTIDEAAWQVSEQDAVLYFLAGGGDRFLRGQGGATANLHLAVEENGRAAWTVAAVRRDGSAFVVAIDAASGERISP